MLNSLLPAQQANFESRIILCVVFTGDSARSNPRLWSDDGKPEVIGPNPQFPQFLVGRPSGLKGVDSPM